MAIDDSERYALLDRLTEEFAARFRRGERPSLNEYAERYPALAQQIRELFPALVKVERAEEILQDRDESKARIPPPSQVGDYRIVREIGHGGMGVVYEAEQVSLGRRVALKVLPWRVAKERTTLERFRREARASARLHHTNIVPVFEVGQDGEICYYAMQFIQGQSLDAVIDELRRQRRRHVKDWGDRPPPIGGPSSQYAKRATRGRAANGSVAESLLSGRFEKGCGGSGPTVATPHSPDGSDKVASEASASAADTSAVMPGGAQLSNVESRYRAFHRGVAHIGRQVAQALAYAHARGIVHRDVKPSNLLLDTEGVAWVSDFGLAKVDDDELTGTGDILGTLRYMAPERFRGHGDARADLYSLGLTLYELLTLRPAFDSPDRVALSEQIKTTEPPRPRSIDPRIPRDLETVVLKAIEKNRGDRYGSADAMAEDLRRFLDDEAILARRAGAIERFLRWARRNPAIAALAGVLTAVLFVATTASALVARRMTSLAIVNEITAQSEAAARFEAERERERAEQHLYSARIGRAESALRLHDAATARGLLDQCRPRPGETDRRGWEWSYLSKCCRPELKTIQTPADVQARCLAVSPDGRLLAVGCWDPVAATRGESPPVPVFLIGLADGHIRHELSAHNLLVGSVAFRPDGKVLATLGIDGTIQVWDTSSGRPLRILHIGRRGLERPKGLSFSPDGKRLAGVDDAGRIRIWDPETGREILRIEQKARSVIWSPAGGRIALVLSDDLGLEIRDWDARADTLHGGVFAQKGLLHDVSWSPDGRRLAAIWAMNDGRSDRRRLTVCDAESGQVIFQNGHSGVLRSLVYSPDGTCLVSAGDDDVLRIFDAGDGHERFVLFTGASQISGVTFSPDGRRLYAAGWGMGGIKVFDPVRDPRSRRIPGWLEQTASLTFDREGLAILGADWEHQGSLMRAEPDGGSAHADCVLPVTNSQGWPRGDFAFSSDGRLLAAPTRRDPTAIGVWDVSVRHRLAVLRGSLDRVTAVAFSYDGRSLVSAAAGGQKGRTTVTLWQLAPAQPIRTFDAETTMVQTVALSDDASKIAAGGGSPSDASGWVIVWDVETGAVLVRLHSLGLVTSVAFHPDGSHLAIADAGEGKVHLWDLDTGERITNPGPGMVSCVRFTSDGKRLAALGYSGNVHLADAKTGEEVLVLRTSGPPAGSGGFTPRLAFSPDGFQIVANAGDRVLNIWELEPALGSDFEPEPGDVAGWLRRSRVLDEQDDHAAALAAFTRATQMNGIDASAWIKHAVWLFRRADSAQARDALARAMAALPDDPGRWLLLARSLGRLGRSEASATVLAGARTLCEQRLARSSDDEIAAAALAESIPDADASAGWTVVRPDVIKSLAGTELTRLRDGSVLASGSNPPVDTYTIEAPIGKTAITALKLEALPERSLTRQPPGRFQRIDEPDRFVVTSLRVGTVDGRSVFVPVSLTANCTEFPDPDGDFGGPRGAIDLDPMSLWCNWPYMGRPQEAIFQTEQPIQPTEGTRLRLELVTGRETVPYSTLRRFRLSVTSRPFARFEPSLQRIKADTERSGATRLGAAYILLGEWESAASILSVAMARSEFRSLDGFLLALAKLQQNRHDEARIDCGRALELAGSDLADEATRDVAIEALMATHGMSLERAERLLLDRAFPETPFCP